ncbi:MAG: DUF1598 domain-containing protein, partial [Pirellulaceae bacterium]
MAICIVFVTGIQLQSSALGDDLASHLASGEFANARQIAERVPKQDRDAALADLAAAQSSAGEYVSASRTVSQIDSGQHRQSAISEIRGVDGAAGGSSLADFGSLMQLIETTVVPDTWEALGGPSTMAPYPQGVYVDPEGTLQECTVMGKSDSLNQLKSMLENPASNTKAGDWRSPSPMRIVSLRRLRDELTKQSMNGQAPADSMLNLSGLSRVQHIILADDDILIAGPVGGVELVDGWFRDRVTGMNTLRSDFLLTCLTSSLNNQPFGCTIDPTPQGLQAAAVVAQGVQSDAIPVGQAAQKMKQALGMQRVEVFGTAGDTPIGYVMVEADRHMKQLALGEAAMPEGVKNYLDVIDDFIAQGTPNQLLLRLWFTAQPRSVRADADKRVFEIAGSP